MKDGLMIGPDMAKLANTIAEVNAKRLDDIKCTVELPLSIGTAKVYHLGKNNKTVRIDIKVGE